MSIQELFQQNTCDLFANTITLANGVLPPITSLTLNNLTVLQNTTLDGNITMNPAPGPAIVNGDLNVTGTATIANEFLNNLSTLNANNRINSNAGILADTDGI